MKVIATIPQGRGTPEKRFEGTYFRYPQRISIFHTDFDKLSKVAVKQTGQRDGCLPAMVCTPNNDFVAMTLDLNQGHVRQIVFEGWTDSRGKWTSWKALDPVHG